MSNSSMLVQRAHTINLHPLNIPSANLSSLEIDLSETEVWEAIKSLPSVKAPGPDGFIGLFYQRCWDIIKLDVMAAIFKLGRV